MSASGPRPEYRRRDGRRVTAHGGPAGRRPTRSRSRGPEGRSRSRAWSRSSSRSSSRSWGWCWALPTTTGWWLLALALGLGLAGRVFGSRVAGAGLLTDAAILLGSVLLVALLTAWGAAVLASPADALLGPDEVPAGRSAAWTLPTRALLDAPRVVSWRVAGTAPLSAPAGLSTPVLDGTARLGLDLHERGLLLLSARRLSLTEPLGLARGGRRLRAGAETVVLPRPLTVPPEVLGALRSRERGNGVLAAPRRRGGGESGDLRPYRPGDPLASIHWRQSARTDSLLVTEREDEESPSVVLALDTAPGSYRGARSERSGTRDDGPARDRERAIRLASSLLRELEAAGVGARLLLDGAPVDGGGAHRALALLPRADEDDEPNPADATPAADGAGHGAHGAPGADGPGPTADLLVTGADGPAPGPAGLGAALVVRVHDGALRLDEGSRP